MSQQEKVTLEQEKHRCLQFLRDKQLNLPEHLQQNADILSTEEHLERINAKLEKIAEAERKAKVAREKKLTDSKAKVLKLKDEFYYFRERILAEVKELDGAHKGLFFEAETAIKQLIKLHKPAKKTRKKVS